MSKRNRKRVDRIVVKLWCCVTAVSLLIAPIAPSFASLSTTSSSDHQAPLVQIHYASDRHAHHYFGADDSHAQPLSHTSPSQPHHARIGHGVESQVVERSRDSSADATAPESIHGDHDRSCERPCAVCATIPAVMTLVLANIQPNTWRSANSHVCYASYLDGLLRPPRL